MLNKFQPDLIHIVSPTLLGSYGLSYATRHKLPAVTSYHTHFVDYLQWFHNKCQKTYAPSTSAVNELLDRGIHNVELWERGIDIEKYSPDYRSLDLRKSIEAENKPILLSVQQPEQKHHFTLFILLLFQTMF